MTGEVTLQNPDSVSILKIDDGLLTTLCENEKLLDGQDLELVEQQDKQSIITITQGVEGKKTAIPKTRQDQGFDPSPHSSLEPSPSLNNELKEEEYLAEPEEEEKEEFSVGDRIVDVITGNRGVVTGYRDGRVVFDNKDFGSCSRLPIMLQKI